VAAEGVFGSDLDEEADAIWDGHRGHFSGGGVLADAGGGHAAFSGEGFVLFPDADEVADGFGADFFDEKFDGVDFLEAERGVEVAGGVDAGPGDAFFIGDLVGVFPYGEFEGAEEGVFRALHEAEKVREVDDACHVRVGELDAIRVNKAMLRHGGKREAGRGLMS
jgi:hypothetical protein